MIKRVAIITAALSFGIIGVGVGQIREQEPGLLAQARVKPDKARQIALSRVRGRILREEILYQPGPLVYSYDIRVGDRPGATHVRVDAMSGEIRDVFQGSDKLNRERLGSSARPCPPNDGEDRPRELQKGMTIDEVTRLLGRPVKRNDSMQGILQTSALAFVKERRNIIAIFAEGVLVKWQVSERES